MTISLDTTITRNFDAASRREWIEANGLGGDASGTISGAAARRYHGLVPARERPPPRAHGAAVEARGDARRRRGALRARRERFPGGRPPPARLRAPRLVRADP